MSDPSSDLDPLMMMEQRRIREVRRVSSVVHGISAPVARLRASKTWEVSSFGRVCKFELELRHMSAKYLLLDRNRHAGCLAYGKFLHVSAFIRD